VSLRDALGFVLLGLLIEEARTVDVRASSTLPSRGEMVVAG
jgi:hypothetical protein